MLAKTYGGGRERGKDTWTPDIAFTTVDLPCATRPMVPAKTKNNIVPQLEEKMNRKKNYHFIGGIECVLFSKFYLHGQLK